MIHTLSTRFHVNSSTVGGMDGLSALLDSPRAHQAFLLCSVFDPPWSLRIADEAPLTIVALVRGQAWLVLDGDEPTRLDAGDIALLRGPGHYTVADHPTTPTQITIHPGQRCTDPAGNSVTASMNRGVRTWGNSDVGETLMLTGTYTSDGNVQQRVLTAIPPCIVLRHDSWTCPYIGLLADEIAKDDPGQEAVLDRLLDLMTIASLRAWLTEHPPAWYRANADPLIGRALRMLQNDPAHPWTVAALAAAVGLSRAALARRFNEIVGEPPMTFLTNWRLTLAADLLRDPTGNVTSVARDVGYNSPFTFSTAFKRLYGISPSQHRSA